jgi:RNA polymerase sigma-70 factor (ECF subfamily)
LVPEQARPECWVDEHGDYLYRFALARVDGPETAEDIVQETFLAALKAAPTFAGRSSERTWLTGILKHKLVDRWRRTQQDRLLADLVGPDDCLDGLYNRAGHWKAAPREWAADERLREVFSLRLLDEMPAPEVCQVLGISATNLWTLLHRARVRLWRCLDRIGFSTPAAED